MHAVLLEMLEDIAGVCRKHGLRCWLYCGTLLGAVREGGFIPWDDDADLAMPEEDCRAFFRLAGKELGDRYTVQTLKNTPAHPWLWMRVFRNGTTYLRRDWKDLPVHHGIAVDIYPMTGVAGSRAGYRMQLVMLNFAKALRHIDYWRTTGIPEDRKLRRVYKVLSKVPGPLRRGMSRAALRLAVKPASRSGRACTLDGAPFVPKYDSRDWEKTTEISLEGIPFDAPAEYDKLLRIMYGDYMVPTPPGKRKSHGDDYGGVIIDTDRDYREYLSGQELI